MVGRRRKAAEFDPADRLRELEDVGAGLSFPVPIHERLDLLVRAAENAGETTSRKEVVAAILLATVVDGEALAEALKSYRLGTVGDAVPLGDEPGVVRLERHRPGRRGRSRQ